MHKFRNTTEEAIHHHGDDDQPTSNVTDHKLSQLQIQWGSYLSIASMIPNVTFLLLNAVFGHRFRSKPRLLTALIIIIVLFIFSDVMVKVNTDSWQDAFLGVTLFTVVIINIMVAIFQVRPQFQDFFKVSSLTFFLYDFREACPDWLENSPTRTWARWFRVKLLEGLLPPPPTLSCWHSVPTPSTQRSMTSSSPSSSSAQP